MPGASRKARSTLGACISAGVSVKFISPAVSGRLTINCAGLARVDFLLESATGKLFINEINTLPGFTSISMFPKMWAHEGLAFPQLVERLIELAFERHAARTRLRYER